MRLNTQSLKQRLSTPKNHQPKMVSTMPLLPRLILAWLAGASFIFALAPYHIWVIGLISPAIVYALVLPQMSGWRAFWLGEMYGMGLWCVGAFWLFTSIHDYGDTSAPVALAMIAFMGAAMGLFHGAMAWTFNRVGKQPASFAALWVIQEWLKTWLFTGFPWLFVGYAFTDLPWLTSLAPVFGVLAISFVAVFIGSSMVEAIRKRTRFFLPSLVLLLISAGLWLIPTEWTHAKDDKNLTVSLIQGNIPQDLKWLQSYQIETLRIYADLTADEWGRDIVVWPEASIPMFQTDAWAFISQVANVASDNQTAWVTGIPYQDIEGYNPQTDAYEPMYNSVMALGDSKAGVYKKQNLVPGGEYMPFQGAIDWLLPDLMSGERSFSAGTPDQAPLFVKNHPIGVAICYEVAYPDTVRNNAKNTDFLLTVSNEAWFGDSPEIWQHQQMAQMRSLETGRWFLRATNTGLTAIINEKGNIVTSIPQNTPGVLRGEVQARTGDTPFMQWGSYPILGLSVLLILISWLGIKQKSNKLR